MSMNMQEIFDRSARHMLAQGQPSLATMRHPQNGMDQRLCAYRGDGGLKCVVGALIPDALYDRGLEGQSASSFEVQEVLIRAGVLKGVGDMDLDRLSLLQHLQSLHDRNNASTWLKGLQEIALRFSLRVVDHPNEGEQHMMRMMRAWYRPELKASEVKEVKVPPFYYNEMLPPGAPQDQPVFMTKKELHHDQKF